MSASFNAFDLIFLVACLVFVMTAFFRGFVKEAFGLFNWVIAFIVSHLLSPFVSNLFVDKSISSSLTDIGIRSVIFVTVFFISLMSTSGLAKELRRKFPKPIDRSLGVLFGLTKVLLIFGIGYSVFVNSMSLFLDKKITKNSKIFPKVIAQARFHDLIQFSAKVVNKPVRAFMGGMVSNISGKDLKDKIAPQNILDKQIENILEQKIKDIDPEKLEKIQNLDNLEDLEGLEDFKGYNKKDIEKMNRLIEILDQ